LFTALLALAEAAVLDPLQFPVDLVEGVFLAPGRPNVNS